VGWVEAFCFIISRLRLLGVVTGVKMNASQKKKQYTLAELTAGLEVTIVGDAQTVISGVGTIQQAQTGQIAFLMNPLYKKYLATTDASAVILTSADANDCQKPVIISRDPYYTYARIAAYFEQKPVQAPGIHPSAVIGEGCQIDPSVAIGPLCVIGQGVSIGPGVVIGASTVIGDGCTIGEGARLDARVTLYYDTHLGQRVHISSGVVIGSDGFGLAKHKGAWQDVPQLGRVVIEDDVAIGANSTLDRGAIEDTVIAKGAKLDNLIQVGHNVRIGENTAIAGCVGIAGSAVIGKNCLIGGGSGIAGHISIADNVMITGMTAVTKSIREPGIYSSGVGGLVTNQEWRKTSARLHRLEHMADRIKALEAALAAVTERDKST
jgi:UDP-3-O-[3-hydroxymyristoyl] glucosamine N-acyltransferase